MYLLMAVEVYKDKVIIGIFATLARWLAVVLVNLLVIEERPTTQRTDAALLAGQSAQPGRHISSFRLFSFGPVGTQSRIVWRCSPADQHVSFDGEPLELEQIATAGLVPEDPAVAPA